MGLGSVMQEETIQSLDKSWLQIKKEGRLKCGAKNTNSGNRNQRRGRVEKISSTDLGMLSSRVKQSCRSKCSVKQPCCKTAPVLLSQGEWGNFQAEAPGSSHCGEPWQQRDTILFPWGTESQKTETGQPKLSALKPCGLQPWQVTGKIQSPNYIHLKAGTWLAK